MEACAKRYGDIFTLRIGRVFTPQVFISNPQLIQEVFSTDPKQLDSGEEEGSRYEKLQERLTALLNPKNTLLQAMLIVFPGLQRNLGSWSPWGQLMRCIKEIDELIYAEIRDRRVQPDSSRTDILSLMMSARDEQGQPMTDVELRDELMTLLIAGLECSGRLETLPSHNETHGRAA